MAKNRSLKKLIRQILQLKTLARKNKWEIEYDKSTDTLYWSPKKVPRGAYLWHINDEIAFYVTPRSTIEGLFMEYFTSNFVQHNEEFEGFVSLLTKKIDKDVYTVDKRKSEVIEHYLKV